MHTALAAQFFSSHCNVERKQIFLVPNPSKSHMHRHNPFSSPQLVPNLTSPVRRLWSCHTQFASYRHHTHTHTHIGKTNFLRACIVTPTTSPQYSGYSDWSSRTYAQDDREETFASSRPEQLEIWRLLSLPPVVPQLPRGSSSFSVSAILSPLGLLQWSAYSCRRTPWIRSIYRISLRYVFGIACWFLQGLQARSSQAHFVELYISDFKAKAIKWKWTNWRTGR